MPDDGARGRGTLVAVVGPSGVGKDTLMNEALAHFGARGDLHLVQRVITRPVDAGGENHRAVEHPEFAALKDAGAFAVSWDAHGLRYGIPAAVHEKLALGHLVIANGSRSALPRFAEVFDPLLVINIVARPEVLASRLEKRGRETREDILRRLKRGSLEVRGPFHVVTIDNSEDLATATRQLVATLSPLLGAPQTA